MDMSRRSFLRGALIVSASAVLPLPALPASYPMLYGDGIHDDTEALNALFRGDTVVCENEMITIRKGEAIHLRGGTYRISSTIIATGPDDVAVKLSGLSIRADDVVGHVLEIGSRRVSLASEVTGITITGKFSGAAIHVTAPPRSFDDDLHRPDSKSQSVIFLPLRLEVGHRPLTP